MGEHNAQQVITLPIAWDRDRLVIENPATVKRIARERLSPSTAKSMEGCPARWAVEKMISGAEDPFAPAPLGTHAHAVMENLFALPSEARTPSTAADLTISQLAKFAAPRADTSRGRWPGIEPPRAPEWVRLITECWSGLFTIEDPTTIEPFGMEVKLDSVEVEGVPFAGFIDRVDNVISRSGEHRLRVVDYKGLDVATPLPTPTGWTTMGDIQVGEQILGTLGDPTTVIGKSQVYNRPCYEVVLSDGARIVCDNVHLWQIGHQVDGQRVSDRTVNADELRRLFWEMTSNPEAGSLVIDNCDPVELPEADLPIDPWKFGRSLALSGTSGITADTVQRYLRASAGQRLAVIDGVMDTDGEWDSKTHTASLLSRHGDVIDVMVELVRSLGGTASSGDLPGGFAMLFSANWIWPLHGVDAEVDGPADEDSIPGTDVHFRRIVQVRPVASVATQCIMVDAPNSLYLCGRELVPTHNTGKPKWAPRGQAHPHDDQLRLYVVALAKKLDLPTSHFTASVYYTKTKFSKERKVAAPRAKLAEVSRRFVKSWEQLNTYTEEAAFPCVTSPLCGWCPLVSTCPAAAAAGLVARLEGLPTAEQLPVRVISELDSVSFLASMEKLRAGPAEVDPFADDEHLNALADAYAGVPAAPKVVIDDDVIDVETDPELAAADPDAAVLPENLDDVERDVNEVVIDFPGIADITAHVLHETRTPDREGTDTMTNALLREDKPFEETAGPASDLNPNSYAATAVFGLVSMAVKVLESNGLPLSRSLVTEMSQAFASIVATVQTEFTGRTSFHDGMHTRLRGALHAAIESSPMPATGDPDDLTVWFESLTKRTRAIATAAISLWDQGAAEMPELTALIAATSKLRAA
ncbi:MAG: PD-(D/E)XK nuclease family protein [Nakamurella sp.]